MSRERIARALDKIGMPNFAADVRASTCQACGRFGSEDTDPLVLVADGWWIHESHVLDPDSGFYRREVIGR